MATKNMVMEAAQHDVVSISSWERDSWGDVRGHVTSSEKKQSENGAVWLDERGESKRKI